MSYYTPQNEIITTGLRVCLVRHARFGKTPAVELHSLASEIDRLAGGAYKGLNRVGWWIIDLARRGEAYPAVLELPGGRKSLALSYEGARSLTERVAYDPDVSADLDCYQSRGLFGYLKGFSADARVVNGTIPGFKAPRLPGHPRGRHVSYKQEGLF